MQEANRMWASASFVGVLIIIGLPLWWKTTEVYRVALPYDKINAFDTDSHYITTELTVLANDDETAQEVARQIERAFRESDVIKLKIRKQVIPSKLQHLLDSVADEQEALEDIGAAFDIKKHNTFYVVQRKPLYQDVWVGNERVAFFRDVKACSTIIQALEKWIYEPSVLIGARSEVADAARQIRFPSGPGYHVVLSVVHPNPQQMKVNFNPRDAIEDYIGSFVDELSDLHNFTLKSQWLHLLDFDFEATEVRAAGAAAWAVRRARLPLLLTRLEGRAATHVSEWPTLNLALYVAPCHRAPLVLHDENEISPPVQAFMSPKWGGVVFGNPTPEECQERVYTPPVNLIMGTFLSQLRKLLGITDKAALARARLAAARRVAPRGWERDALLRLRALQQLASAETSLKSLAKLLGEISNIVINDEVGASINLAVSSIHLATEHMERGDLLEAHRFSQQAFLAAETAFMEPSLLALLYFPDDQKYAIYIPLFLPIMFPVVLSLKNLLLWFRGKPVHKEKTD
ncbi:GPI transamidase component PIG-S isoform X2 [Nymphalis io]|uniref:GPI transamidase component PIG-S isoform X2 n=1 Tax=Inachis io TaxID=171585 RepID=UPI00216A1823|nr:GPI transamidase component PIG-S isoform X2 [Nymphalis io]